MIYAGFIHFNEPLLGVQGLSSSLESYTQVSSTVIKRNSLILCYGKLPKSHDMDEVWENNSSVLMGRIFDKAQQCTFGKQDFKNLSFLDKYAIFEKIWGKYIYIYSNNNFSKFEIIIDSTGQLPFFYYLFSDGNILFSSHIAVIFKVLSQKPEVNWPYLCSYLIHGNSSTIQTPFKNIYELPPACSLTVTKDGHKTKSFWNPVDLSKTEAPQTDNAVDSLQATLKPWIEPYKNICVSLSGGLDSSSLVYCLKNIIKEEQTLSALNYFHASVKSSNELTYARKVCQETDIELIEVDSSHSLPFDPSHVRQPLTPNKPFSGLISLKCSENVSNHIPSDGPWVFIEGHGSDHIFMSSPSKKSLSDYILEQGLKGSTETLKNITNFYRAPFLPILKENLISLISYFFSLRSGKRHFKNIQDAIPNWVKQEAHQEASVDFVHPIYEHMPSQLLPGKYEQIDALYEGLASIHMAMNQINPTYYPFLYKPVVEFALSLPTYDLFDKGYDRYPLRKAISDRFKTGTVWRRDKSQTTGILQLGVKKNLEYILAICLEGQFAKQNFIDRVGLHKTIIAISNGDTTHIWPFIGLASTEIFLKYWEEKIS